MKGRTTAASGSAKKKAAPATLDNTPGTGNNDVLTPMGVRWQQLMSQWHTNVTSFADGNGTICFTGFYGDYTLGGQPFAVALTKGTKQYAAKLTAPPTWSIWNAASSGGWSTAGNWQTGGVANASGQTAYFGPAVAARTVSVDGNRTVGMLVFDSSSSYTLSAGGGTLALQGLNNAAGHTAVIDVTAGSHAIAAPVALADDTTINVASAGGSLTIWDLQPTSAVITKTGAGTLAVNSIRAGRLSVATGTVRVLPGGGGGGAAAGKISSLSIGAGAVLDLADSDLVVATAGATGTWTGTAYDGITGQIATGRGNGTWNGAIGIKTSAAGANDYTTLGVAKAGDVRGIADSATAMFGGQMVHGADTIVMFTYGGDATLDGVINMDDYTQIDSSVSAGGAFKGWFNGDFNYDGNVDIDDYTIIDSNFPVQGAPFSSSVESVAAVPEPVAAGAALLAGAAALLRRRRRSGRARIA